MKEKLPIDWLYCQQNDFLATSSSASLSLLSTDLRTDLRTDLHCVIGIIQSTLSIGHHPRPVGSEVSTSDLILDAQRQETARKRPKLRFQEGAKLSSLSLATLILLFRLND